MEELPMDLKEIAIILRHLPTKIKLNFIWQLYCLFKL